MTPAPTIPDARPATPVSDLYRGPRWAEVALAVQRDRLGATAYYAAARYNPSLVREALAHRDEARAFGLT